MADSMKHVYDLIPKVEQYGSTARALKPLTDIFPTGNEAHNLTALGIAAHMAVVCLTQKGLPREEAIEKVFVALTAEIPVLVQLAGALG